MLQYRCLAIQTIMQIKIISYNIWDLPLWFVKNRKARVKRVAEYLAQSGADIICIQEAWSRSGRATLYRILGEAGYEHVSARERLVLIGNGGLLTFSKFPIVSKKFTPFSRLSAAFVELFAAKGVLEVTVDTPQGKLSVFNTHLHSPSWVFGQTIRLRQMKRVLDVLAQDEAAAVLAGDFNEDKLWEQKEFTKILNAAAFLNPLSVALDMPPTYRLENEFVNIWINRAYAPSRFDYIFVRSLDKLGFTVKTYQPLYLTPALSDHDPVVVVFGE